MEFNYMFYLEAILFLTFSLILIAKIKNKKDSHKNKTNAIETKPKVEITLQKEIVADEILANKENNLTKIKQVESQQPKAQLKKPKVVNISVDPDKGFYRNKDLNLDEVKYLIHKKYKEYYFYSTLTRNKEKYLLRPRFNESPQHCFLTFEIADYLKKFTNKVYLYQTKKPDIVFETSKNKFAIEIETGKILKSNKNRIKEKSIALNKEFPNRWFFVVTNRNLAKPYKQFGKTHTKLTIISQLNKILRKG